MAKLEKQEVQKPSWSTWWENRLLGWASLVLVLAAILAWWLPRGATGVLDLVGDDARKVLTFTLFMIGRVAVTPIFLMKGQAYLALLSFISAMTRKILFRRVEETGAGAQRSFVLARFASIVVYTLGLTVGLESAGLNLNSLAIVGGTLGIGVGFGLQPVVANWVAGLVLLVEAPFRIGDRIDVGNTSGVVVRVGGRSTWVRTYDNEVIIVPNSEFTTHRVTNWTVDDPRVRLHIEIDVDCSSNLQQVKDSLVAIAKRHPDVLPDPQPEAVLAAMGDSSFNFYLRFWTIIRDHDNYALLSDLYCMVIDEFAKQGIVMPYPIQDINVRSVDSPLVIKEQKAS